MTAKLPINLDSLLHHRTIESERVAHGGHNIPAKDIVRRFPRSLNNLLNLFSHRVDFCICFMNDGGTPTLVFEQQGADRRVIDQDCYNVMLNGVGQ